MQVPEETMQLTTAESQPSTPEDRVRPESSPDQSPSQVGVSTGLAHLHLFMWYIYVRSQVLRCSTPVENPKILSSFRALTVTYFPALILEPHYAFLNVMHSVILLDCITANIFTVDWVRKEKDLNTLTKLPRGVSTTSNLLKPSMATFKNFAQLVNSENTLLLLTISKGTHALQ